MAQIVETLGKFAFDHVALAVHDTKAGAAWLEAATGAKVNALEPEDGQWYWSHSIDLLGGASLEIIGPNPSYRGFHPMKEILRGYKTPAPLFWHLRAVDFDLFCKMALLSGNPIERVEHVCADTKYGRRRYSRGIVGPGFRSTRPCVIFWQERPDRSARNAQAECQVVNFTLTSPKAESLNAFFESVQVDLKATTGPETITLTLDTPKGELSLSAPGVVFEGGTAVLQTAALWIKSLFRSSSWGTKR